MQSRDIAATVLRQQYDQQLSALTSQLFEARANYAALDAEHVEALRQLSDARKEIEALKKGEDAEAAANADAPEPGTE